MKKVAVLHRQEVLEVRDLTDPNKIARLRVGLGTFQWSPDETRILLKRAPEKKSGDLGWTKSPRSPGTQRKTKEPPPVTQPAFVSILHGLTFRDFAITPDGPPMPSAAWRANCSIVCPPAPLTRAPLFGVEEFRNCTVT